MNMKLETFAYWQKILQEWIADPSSMHKIYEDVDAPSITTIQKALEFVGSFMANDVHDMEGIEHRGMTPMNGSILFQFDIEDFSLSYEITRDCRVRHMAFKNGRVVLCNDWN